MKSHFIKLFPFVLIISESHFSQGIRYFGPDLLTPSVAIVIHVCTENNRTPNGKSQTYVMLRPVKKDREMNHR